MIHIAILIGEIILMLLKNNLSLEDATSKVSKSSGVDYKSLYDKIPNKYKKIR
ncbi:TPA: hypothetical protein KQW76_002750 [Clostridioides difficile]|nr:hypothetical protein [Clostridioides difficile]EJA6689691.1 hypothetical protein [Clostridioides difficile]EQH51472.1 hypothetical protein QMG_3591 [Clostridioides difficile DA00256]MBJ9760741.1 hypothetical protein [Clostridioides difficile]MCA0587054.1 hypothetical protein [Clostridioides difficile]MDO0484836.1 hypothetical protein [Clostridioides difficile]